MCWSTCWSTSCTSTSIPGFAMVVETPIDSTQSLGEMGTTISDLGAGRERRWLRSLTSNRFALVAGILVILLVLVSGYYPRFDTPIMRVMDGMMAFPSILLAIAIMASLGPSTRNVFIALTVVYVPTIARLVRGSTLVLKQQPFV